jgi:hypothetical protein
MSFRLRYETISVPDSAYQAPMAHTYRHQNYIQNHLFPSAILLFQVLQNFNERDIQFRIQVCDYVRNGNRYYLHHTHSVYLQLCGRRAESRTVNEVGNEVCECSVYVLN